MLGFELTIKGETISTALKYGTVVLVATQVAKEQDISIELSVMGFDKTDLQETEQIIWYHAILQEGDEFTVRVKEICENSAHQEIKRHPSDNERKLKSYNSLKKELESRGLL